MNRLLIDSANVRSPRQRRCSAKAESTEKRCSHKALKGHRYCAQHLSNEDPTREVLSHYANIASEGLRAKLLEIAELPAEEKKSLDTEAEILIHLVSQAWTIYDQVCFQGKLDAEGKSNGAARGKARVVLADAIDRLSKVKIANAKLIALQDDKVSVDALRDMACQIMDALEEEIEDKKIFRRVCRKIEGIRMEREPNERARVVMDID